MVSGWSLSLGRRQVVSKIDFVGLLSFLPLWGQEVSFIRPSQSQHRLQFHWLQPVHRWGALELDDLKSWVKCLTAGENARELWLALHKDSFISFHSHPRC